MITYQPASRDWTFQWLETGIYLTVAVLLAWGCFWWFEGARTRRGQAGSGDPGAG